MRTKPTSAPAEHAAPAAARPAAAAATGVLEYDLHGLVGVRLVDATPADAAAVEGQLGLAPTALGRDPDVVVRYVDEVAPASPLRLLGLDDAGFTDDAFLVLRGRHKRRARVAVPVDRIGRGCELVCERGVGAVPFLVPAVNFAALAKGAVPLHASSFVHEGVGVVVTGWSKGGKTEALLAFMQRGARYVGDEWVYLLPEGRRVVGIPEPIRLWDWHLRQLPGPRALVPARDRRRLRALRGLTSLEASLARRGGALGRAGRIATRARPLLERQLHVDLDPRRLFPPDAVALAGRLDRLFFVGSHASDEIAVRPVAPEEVARRMVFSLQYERLDLLAAYLKFRFAFPDRENPVLERAEELQREALARAVAGTPSFSVYHPYPVELAKLFEAMRPHCA